jgi:hypothetical protein
VLWWYDLEVKNIARVTISALIMTTGLGLAGLGVASVAEAQPGPFPQWCPGDFWDPGWGGNWDGGRCHDGGPGFRHDDGRGGWNHDDGHGGGWNHGDGHGGGPNHDDGHGHR